jgi:hypothetical protein
LKLAGTIAMALTPPDLLDRRVEDGLSTQAQKHRPTLAVFSIWRC